jgi:putative YphP/YqiW family bacilliredoxin
MPYPESFIGPMREELTRLGVQELRTTDEVDAVVRQKSAGVGSRLH